MVCVHLPLQQDVVIGVINKIMKNHVTSLELSQRLKALGVKQESEFYFMVRVGHPGKPVKVFNKTLKDDFLRRVDEDWEIIASAFLASELMEMMPTFIVKGTGVYYLQTIKADQKFYIVHYRYEGSGDIALKFDSNTPQEALGLMLEYLLVNGLMKN